MDTPVGYYTVAEAAAVLKTVRKGGVIKVGGHPTLVYRFIYRKQLPAVRWQGRWLIKREDMLRFNRQPRKHGQPYRRDLQ